MNKILSAILLTIVISTKLFAAGDATKPMSVDWSFNGFFGKFDRAQLQRGFQAVSYTHLTLPTILRV